MAHEHNVQDTDPHFTIDKTTREISIKSGTSNIMQFDHNSERLTFELPREIDTHDMTACNVVEIHYTNVDSQTKEINADVYEVTDMAVSPDDESKAVLSWLISRNATKFAGSLNFLIRFKCVAADGSVDYVWNTAIYKGLTVSNGMDNTGAVVEKYSDVLEKWRHDLFNTGGTAARIAEIELMANNWVGDDSPFSQVVEIPGVTMYSQIDLTPSVEQLVIFHDKDLAFVAENEDGVVTVYAIGDRPQNDYTMQVTIKEVSV